MLLWAVAGGFLAVGLPLGADTARAAASPAPRHAVMAPAGDASLSGYLLQPPDGLPGGDEEDGEADSIIIERDQPAPTGGQQPGSQIQQPAFGTVDTTTRADTLFQFPSTQFTPAETVGVNILNPGTTPTPDAKPGPSRRGILGIHPTAIIAAMVVLHVFVVGLVTK